MCVSARACWRSGLRWRALTGNEIGLLLANHLWRKLCREQSDQQAPSDVVMLRSTVSSSQLARLARHYGFQCHETLTGFKWLGNKASFFQKQGKIVLFAFEEAIGFMLGKVGGYARVCACACCCFVLIQ